MTATAISFNLFASSKLRPSGAEVVLRSLVRNFRGIASQNLDTTSGSFRSLSLTSSSERKSDRPAKRDVSSLAWRRSMVRTSNCGHSWGVASISSPAILDKAPIKDLK
jgi:hypothetical protein